MREIAERLKVVENKLDKLVSLHDDSLVFAKVASWNSIHLSEKIHFRIKESGILIPFCIVGVEAWLNGKAELKEK